MGPGGDTSKTIEALRQALADRDDASIRRLAGQLVAATPAVSPADAQDLLERASSFGPASSAQAVWDAFGGDFPLAGYALALALRCSREDVARYLLAQGVDLLGPVRRPAYARGHMPHEGTFTRFALTRESPTLFLNNMDPTVSTAVFEPFRKSDHLAGQPYEAPVDLGSTCNLVVRLSAEGLFDPTAFDDLLRAAAVRAWHALRHARGRDEGTASTCLACARRLVGLHARQGLGDDRIEAILGNLVVPRADQTMVAFACEVAPQAFLARLSESPWLQEDATLVAAMVPHLEEGLRGSLAPATSPEAQDGRSSLLASLARGGRLAQLRQACAWPGFADAEALRQAMVAASEAGHAEEAAWLLARLQEEGAATDSPAPNRGAGKEESADPTRPPLDMPFSPLTSLDAQVLQKGRSEAQKDETALVCAGEEGAGQEDAGKTGRHRQTGVGMPSPAGASPSPEGTTPAAAPVASPEGTPSPPVTSEAPKRAPAAAGEPAAPAGTEGDVPQEVASLALEVVTLARSELVAKNPFLASAASALEPMPAEPGSLRAGLATDGAHLFLDPVRVLENFQATRSLPAHDVAHVLAHCILLHPFVGSKVRAREWDLATDVVAEEVATELLGPREGERGQAVSALVSRVSRAIDGRLTTERLYRALREGAFADERDSWPALVRVDDHLGWYPEGETEDTPGSPEAGGEQGEGDGGTESQGSGAGMGGEEPRLARDDAGDGQEGESGSEGPSQASPEAAAPRSLPTDAELEATRERWEHLAKSARVDLETLSRARGSQLSGLTRELEVAAHEQVDYREFLRQFATESEEVHLSDDEFDYVFYTYGLEAYGNMPLIEPLEYRSERRIHDFAIVIDTSSSVTLPVVQQFVDTTFDVLTSEASFSEQINVHVIQADQRVQSDTRLTSLADLDRWRRSIKLRGFGGTDFRPAFRYVADLQRQGEFDDLRGLIYFTDGWGIYPEQMPPFPTTFVFFDEDHRPELVPSWALQITLHPGEAASMSVY